MPGRSMHTSGDAGPGDYPELEIGLSRVLTAGEPPAQRSYAVELRFTEPDSDVDKRERATCPLDLDRLAERIHDATAYGQALGEGLFAVPAIAAAFEAAQARAESLGAPLRLRLAIAADAPELHALRWELLRAPDGTAIGASERVLLSRYLASADWQPVRLRPQATLRALVAVADAPDLADYGLAPIDGEAELARVRAVMPGIEIEALVGPRQATPTAIADRLRDGFDVLYLVAHGSVFKGEPVVWLEKEAGGVARIPGAELVARIAELRLRPRLCVLVSCHSAGEGSGALAALGPELARAGVAAVVAMQSNFAMATSEVLMPRFFAELLVDGQVDRALSVARAAARETRDWWVPVLFTRLRSGRIWYTPGFGGERFEKWPSLLEAIAKGRCTPVLGPALSDMFHGSSRELARRWADEYGYPMAPGGREDLPSVAQYLAVHQDERFPIEHIEASLREEAARRFPEALAADASRLSLAEALARAADWRLARGEFDPFEVLARLPCKLYITTAGDDLLAHHLRKIEGAGGRPREPEVALCPWSDPIPPDQESLRADPARPLVYHLFGRYAEPDTLVITENDIFDFLINVNPTSKVQRIPTAVSAALVSSALLILGFPLDDWKFRVFFRSLMNLPGKQLRKGYTHVAAQVDPEDGHTIDGARARRYLENYFEASKITIFWGSADDFLRELGARLPKGAP